MKVFLSVIQAFSICGSKYIVMSCLWWRLTYDVGDNGAFWVDKRRVCSTKNLDLKAKTTKLASHTFTPQGTKLTTH